MRLNSAFVSGLVPTSRDQSCRVRVGHQSQHRWLIPSGFVVAAAIATGWAEPVAAFPQERFSQIAQALPTPLPPIPFASNGTSLPGEQYVVIINGNSDLLLEQVRQIEPGAFVNFIEGASVIQAGRFSSLENAQLRANELAAIGLGAQIKPASPTSAPTTATASSDFVPAVPISTTGGLPPVPVAATPSSVEFGQAPPFQPAPSSTIVPAAAPPPSTAVPPTVRQSSLSGYYVVVPGQSAALQDLADRVIRLGASSSLVSMRESPRGPHIAVGPYENREIAQEWSNYLRDSGLDARVHYE